MPYVIVAAIGVVCGVVGFAVGWLTKQPRIIVDRRAFVPPPMVRARPILVGRWARWN